MDAPEQPTEMQATQTFHRVVVGYLQPNGSPPKHACGANRQQGRLVGTKLSQREGEGEGPAHLSDRTGQHPTPLGPGHLSVTTINDPVEVPDLGRDAGPLL
jgi:hypothetical protein